MLVAPEFITRDQFSDAGGQGFPDLVTGSYAIASLIFAFGHNYLSFTKY
jgi:hypothetical protein